MKIFFNKTLKKYSINLVLSLLIISATLSAFPQKTEAQAPQPVFDIPNTIQGTVNAAASVGNSFSTYALWLKEYVLDGLGTMLLKQIIRQITASVVTWINSGFEGSPSFVTDPGSFFLDVADQITGDFLSKKVGPLNALCSNFNIDIRIALAFKYHPNRLKRYSCTLGTIIKNSRSAIKNATLNGFTAGDFRQGGWPAFASLTTEPQNNIFGAYLEADSELSFQVASAKLQQRDELGQGKGFLSFKVCKDIPVDQNFLNNAAVVASENPTDPRLANYYEDTGVGTVKTCKTETPGSLIENSLSESVAGPMRELGIADEINEIVNALFAQLVTQILQAGLGGVSRKGPDGSSYLQKTVADLTDENNPQIKKIRNYILDGMDTYIDNTKKALDYMKKSLLIILNIQSTYTSAKLCYANKTNLTPQEEIIVKEKIREIDSILTSKPPYATTTQVVNTTNPFTGLVTTSIEEIVVEIVINGKVVATTTAAKLNEEFNSKNQSNFLKTLESLRNIETNGKERLDLLEDIKTKTTASKNILELNEQAQRYSELVSGRTLATEKDVQDAKKTLNDMLDTGKDEGREIRDMRNDANFKLQECQAFVQVNQP